MKIHTEAVNCPMIGFQNPKESLEFCKEQVLPPAIKYDNKEYALLAVNPENHALFYVNSDGLKELIEIEHEEMLQMSSKAELGTYYNFIAYDNIEEGQAEAKKHDVPFKLYTGRLDDAKKFEKYKDDEEFQKRNSVMQLVRARADGMLLYGVVGEGSHDTMTLYTNVVTIKNQLKSGGIIDFAELTK